MLEVTQQDEFFAALQNKLTDFSDYLSIVFIEFFDWDLWLLFDLTMPFYKCIALKNNK